MNHIKEFTVWEQTLLNRKRGENTMNNNASVEPLTDREIESVEGGFWPIVAIAVAGIAASITAFTNGYTIGKDIAEMHNFHMH